MPLSSGGGAVSYKKDVSSNSAKKPIYIHRCLVMYERKSTNGRNAKGGAAFAARRAAGRAKACLNAAPPLALRPFVLLYSLQFIWYFYPEGKLGRNSAKNIPIFKDFKPIIC